MLFWQSGCVFPPTLQCWNDSNIYSKWFYDTQSHWVSSVVKLSITLQSVSVSLIAVIISALQCLIQAADRRLFHYTTAVNEVQKRPFPSLISLCVSVYLGTPDRASLIILEIPSGGKHTHTHTRRVVNFSVINKWNIDILCGDCTQSAQITKLIEEERGWGLLVYHLPAEKHNLGYMSACILVVLPWQPVTQDAPQCHGISTPVVNTHTHTFSQHWWMFRGRVFLWQELKHSFSLTKAFGGVGWGGWGWEKTQTNTHWGPFICKNHEKLTFFLISKKL